MLTEFSRHRLIAGISASKFQRDLQHVLREERHPCRAVRLLQAPTRGQLRAAIEDTDVVEAKKSTFEHVAPGWILPVDPPRKIEHQAIERAFEESRISLAGEFFLMVVEG